MSISTSRNLNEGLQHSLMRYLNSVVAGLVTVDSDVEECFTTFPCRNIGHSNLAIQRTSIGKSWVRIRVTGRNLNVDFC